MLEGTSRVGETVAGWMVTSRSYGDGPKGLSAWE